MRRTAARAGLMLVLSTLVQTAAPAGTPVVITATLSPSEA